MAVKMIVKHRRGTTAEWQEWLMATNNNGEYVNYLLDGEIGLEDVIEPGNTPNRLRLLIGDGKHHSYEDLPKIDLPGYAKVQGNAVVSQGYDYAEYFQWADGNPDNEDRTGYFVTIVENTRTIRKATSEDKILGITSKTASIIGNWQENERDSSWAIVGMLGVVEAKHDGTCTQNGYAMVNDNGEATLTDKPFGYKIVNVDTEDDTVELVLGNDSDMIARIKTSITEIKEDIREVTSRTINGKTFNNNIILTDKDINVIVELPDGLIAKEYIGKVTNKGVAFDTGIGASSNITIEGKILADTSDAFTILSGRRVKENTPTVGMYLMTTTKGKLNVLSGTTSQKEKSYDRTKPFVFKLSNTEFVYDGEVVYEYEPSEYDTITENEPNGVPIHLFVSHYYYLSSDTLYKEDYHDGAIGENGIRIYWLKIYDGDELVRDFIPCVDNAGKSCLYDLVTNTVFYNRFTDPSIKGYNDHPDYAQELIVGENVTVTRGTVSTTCKDLQKQIDTGSKNNRQINPRCFKPIYEQRGLYDNGHYYYQMKLDSVQGLEVGQNIVRAVYKNDVFKGWESSNITTIYSGANQIVLASEFSYQPTHLAITGDIDEDTGVYKYTYPTDYEPTMRNGVVFCENVFTVNTDSNNKTYYDISTFIGSNELTIESDDEKYINLKGINNISVLNSDSEGAYNRAAAFCSHVEGAWNLALGIESHAEGGYNQSVGVRSHTEGSNNIANGDYSHAEGINNTSNGKCSHVEGENNDVSVSLSHAEGFGNTVYGGTSHAEGEGNNITFFGSRSHVEGGSNTISGGWSHAEGYGNTIVPHYSHAEGVNNTINKYGKSSHIEGADNDTSGEYSHVEGVGNTITVGGKYSHVEGGDNEIYSIYSHAEGYGNTINEICPYSHIEGEDNTISGNRSHVEGRGNTVSGTYSHAEGYNNEISKHYSHAEGRDNNVSGSRSHAEGTNNFVCGDNSHAEGCNNEINNVIDKTDGKTTITTQYAHAEGSNNKIFASWSHVEGFKNNIYDKYSHAEGERNNVYSKYAHAEGLLNTIEVDESDPTKAADAAHVEGSSNRVLGAAYSGHAEGSCNEVGGVTAHVEGSDCAAYGNFSHAEGLGTMVTGRASHVQGRYNYIDSDGNSGNYAHIVGNGDENKRSNAHTLDWNGNAWFAGNVASDTGIILVSPNKTKFIITVNDDGQLITTKLDKK